MRKELELSFKGARDYLHGTDMYNAVLQLLTGEREYAGLRDIDVSIHKMVSKQVDAISGEDLSPAVRPAVTCGFSANGSRQQIVLVETNRPVTGRYPYDEDAIVRDMAVDVASQRGTLRSAPGYSPIEIWVAMTKAVHLRVFDPSTKWLFVRARFPEYVRSLGSGEWATTIMANFKDKLTRNDITRDGIKVGEIFFSPKAAHARN